MKNVKRRIAKIALGSSLARHVMARLVPAFPDLHFAPWLSLLLSDPFPRRSAMRGKTGLSTRPRELPGIALNETSQLLMLDQLQPYYDSHPFSAAKTPNRRYFNARPHRIIEIGSGYSSCVKLDTNEIFFAITCIHVCRAREFEIVLFNTFLERFHRNRFIRTMPLKNEGGSIWLRALTLSLRCEMEPSRA
jgi:hypothetical protein